MASRFTQSCASPMAPLAFAFIAGCGSTGSDTKGGSSGAPAGNGATSGASGATTNAGDAAASAGSSGGSGSSVGSGSSGGASGGATSADGSTTATDSGGSTAWDGATNYMSNAPPNFGPNVLVFDPSMSMATIQTQINTLYAQQSNSEFGTNRYALFFKPGNYTLDIQVGYYMQVVGLGQSPADVVITGAVRSKDTGGGATTNFWRSVENLTIIPVATIDAGVNIWAVSQGVSMRRVHVKGALNLSDRGNSSGGFLSDSVIDTRVTSGSQQQWFTRNTQLGSWVNGNWNMVNVGVVGPLSSVFPPFSVVAQTPVVRQKPFMSIDAAGNYSVTVPALDTNSQGPSWLASAPMVTQVPIGQFYIVHPATDTAATINAALNQGANLIFTPGVYSLNDTLRVGRPDTIIVGLGLPTLVPTMAAPTLAISDVDGVKMSGFIFDAGPTSTPTILQVGTPGSAADHSMDPTFLQDIYCRVGGGTVGTASSCMTIESSNVIGDNFWLWRADHGAGARWTTNMGDTGLIVNGKNITIYGLAVEHFQKYQTMWNGDGGRVYFYQSEFPYDPPSQAAWQHGTVNGYASYKVADTVTTHQAMGIGVWCNFGAPIVVDNAFEAPSSASGIQMHHLVTRWLSGNNTSSIKSVLNGAGGAATPTNVMPFLP